MSTVATTKIADAYEEKFGNFDRVAHPSVFYLPEFGELLQKAIDRNSPLTRAEVDQAFGTQSWEW